MTNARQYLSAFYSSPVDVTNKRLLKFYGDAYRSANGSMLEFGGGPTIHALISAGARVDRIAFCDKSNDCLEEVKNWIDARDSAFDWKDYVRNAVAIELGIPPELISDSQVNAREDLLRSRLNVLSVCDAFSSNMGLPFPLESFDIVASNFCLDGITDTHKSWFELNRRLIAFLKPGGIYVQTAVRNGRHWEFGSNREIAVSLGIDDLLHGFALLGVSPYESLELPLAGRTGYDGIIGCAGVLSARV